VSVAVVVPVLGRPWRVEPLRDSLLESQGDVPLELLFVASPNDEAEIQELRRCGVDFLVSSWPSGPADWARKVNLAYRETRADWIFTGADDLCFCPGWADRALECAATSGAGVVGTQDHGNIRVRRGEHATHSLVARWYADEYGTVEEKRTVVSELYDHNFVDDELVETAKGRGLFVFCNAAEVPHLHPNWRQDVKRDATYELGQEQFWTDRIRFIRRRHLFG
jgi:hypothetical protein